MKDKSGVTVKELKEMFNAYEDHKELYFGGLYFYRLKDRGDHVQVEFSQTMSEDDNGKVSVTNHY